MSKNKLLIIEDNPGDVRLIREMLLESGPQFDVVSEGMIASGLLRIGSEKLDLLLLDLGLPDSTGLDGLERVQFAAPDLPVIVLTGRKDQELALRAVQMGAQDYLVKGEFESGLLLRSISYAVQRKAVGVELRKYRERLEEMLKERTVQLLELEKKNAQLRELSDRLSAALSDKDVLLREVYHRTKNNMQIISSLIDLQAAFMHGKDPAQVFKETRHKIKSMALVHEKLYRSRNLSMLSLADYTNELASSILQSFKRGEVELAVRGEDVPVSLDTAVGFGLVLNELMTNSLKYAFTNGGKGEIEITISNRREDEVELIFRDNGPGLPPGLNIRKGKSLGLKIVNQIVRKQLNGSLEIENDGGALFRIRYRKGENEKKGLDSRR